MTASAKQYNKTSAPRQLKVCKMQNTWFLHQEDTNWNFYLQSLILARNI